MEIVKTGVTLFKETFVVNVSVDDKVSTFWVDLSGYSWDVFQMDLSQFGVLHCF